MRLGPQNQAGSHEGNLGDLEITTPVIENAKEVVIVLCYNLHFLTSYIQEHLHKF